MKMELDTLWLILAILIGTFIFLFEFLKRINEWYYVGKLGEKRHSLPPGDMGWPLLGNKLSFLRAFRSNDPDSFLNNLVERYGRTGIYKTHLFGSPSIIVCTPETCSRVLMDDEQFGVGYSKSLKQLVGKRTFLNVSKSEHKRLRKLMTSPMIGHEALTTYLEHIENNVIASLEEWAAMDRPIEFSSEVKEFTFKVAMHFLLGSSGDSIIGSVEKYYPDLSSRFSVAVDNTIPDFAFRGALKARNELMKILRTVLNDRRAMRGNDQAQMTKRGMIDLLMEIEDENDKKLGDEDIVDLILLLLLVGVDSTAKAVMWVTILLHQHPRALQRAKEEQEEIVKKRPSTQKRMNIKEIKQMEYLSKVINETLRITNLLFANFREAITDVTIKGYIIPKGWKVLTWSRGVHMDPDNYPAPKEFDPSRWDNHTTKPGCFIPFGTGSRRCIGSDIGKLEISVFIHYFLLNYKLERLNPECPVAYLPSEPSDNCLAKITKLK